MIIDNSSLLWSWPDNDMQLNQQNTSLIPICFRECSGNFPWRFWEVCKADSSQLYKNPELIPTDGNETLVKVVHNICALDLDIPCLSEPCEKKQIICSLTHLKTVTRNFYRPQVVNMAAIFSSSYPWCQLYNLVSVSPLASSPVVFLYSRSAYLFLAGRVGYAEHNYLT